MEEPTIQKRKRWLLIHYPSVTITYCLQQIPSIQPHASQWSMRSLEKGDRLSKNLLYHDREHHVQQKHKSSQSMGGRGALWTPLQVLAGSIWQQWLLSSNTTVTVKTRIQTNERGNLSSMKNGILGLACEAEAESADSKTISFISADG